MISKKEIKNIANLARLNLTEEEAKEYKEDLSLILDYFEKLKSVNLSGVNIVNYATDNLSIMREDEVKKEKSENREDLLNLPSEKKEDYFKVKSIL